ncbi:Rho1 guanine nucleotide exchange factor 1 [Astathelohania contejeani]|uniref:Rho1 guanine nucleotide exchange factor 1 n=1 Tax=Astathelohania contejeani TaxID=164912 RepID=A0ABQ7I251_9MICR|nr:Rho1 guanine nucleotide exchange factor 1 [Thelohania contejeani]
MANERKRLEALSELFESEKSYIEDMVFYGINFKNLISKSSSLTSRKKAQILETAFVNIDRIIDIHKSIAKEMAERNEECRKKENDATKIINLEGGSDSPPNLSRDIYRPLILTGIAEDTETVYKSLEYHTIYLKKLEKFGVYNGYSMNLPKSEYLIKHEMDCNKLFKEEIRNFLIENQVSNLGIEHFLYRSSQKLARYGLLLKAIQKNEQNETYKEDLELLIANLKEITKNIDETYGDYNAQFTIYMLRKSLFFKPNVNQKYAIGLFARNRKILKKGELLVKFESSKEAKLLNVIILDHMILICDTVVTNDNVENYYIAYEPIPLFKYIQKDTNVFLGNDDNLKNFVPLSLMERSGSKVLCFYFKEEQIRNIYNDILKTAIKKNTKSIIKCAQLNPETIISRETVNCVSTNEEENNIAELSSDESSSTCEEDETISDSDEELGGLNRRFHSTRNHSHRKSKIIANHGQTQSMRAEIKNYSDEDLSTNTINSRSCFSNFCSKRDWGHKNIKISIPENFHPAEASFIYSTSSGVYYKKNETDHLIYSYPAKKILFLENINLVVLLVDKTMYASLKSDNLNAEPFCTNTEMFFYGKTKEKSIIAAKKYTSESTSSIFLFSIEKNENEVSIELYRRLYIGFQLYKICFFNTKLIIASKEFEIVDIDTLQTQELIDPLDFIIPYYLLDTNNPGTARDIFKLSSDTFLVCYDRIGFLIDNYGGAVSNHLVFSWYCIPNEFKIFKKYIVCISDDWLHGFNLKTANIAFYFHKKNLHFVKGDNTGLVHDGHTLYRIVL